MLDTKYFMEAEKSTPTQVSREMQVVPAAPCLRYTLPRSSRPPRATLSISTQQNLRQGFFVVSPVTTTFSQHCVLCLFFGRLRCLSNSVFPLSVCSL